jgi:hypothetical protein
LGESDGIVTIGVGRPEAPSTQNTTVNSALRSIHMNGNKIGGPDALPACLSDTLLEILALSYNLLTGSIPSTIFQPALKDLELAFNGLEGTIPETIGKSSQLEILALQENKLEGHLPKTFTSLTSLKILTLRSNRLSGKWPVPAVGNDYTWTGKIKIMDLRKNSFSGPLPFRSFAAFPSLETLLLNNNAFTGHLPDCRGSVTGRLDSPLNAIAMSSNRLHGPVGPFMECIMKLKANGQKANDQKANSQKANDQNDRGKEDMVAKELDHGAEEDEEAIAGSEAQVSRANSLLLLDLGKNDFTGTVPHNFFSNKTSSFDNLIAFAVNNNRLNGRLPAHTSSMSHLRHMAVQGNQFTGPLPDPMPSSLTNFLVHDNGFNGRQPKLPQSLFTGSSNNVLMHNNWLSCSMRDTTTDSHKYFQV